MKDLDSKATARIEKKLDDILRIVRANCSHRHKTVICEPQELNDGAVESTCIRCGEHKYWCPSDE